MDDRMTAGRRCDVCGGDKYVWQKLSEIVMERGETESLRNTIEAIDIELKKQASIISDMKDDLERYKSIVRRKLK